MAELSGPLGFWSFPLLGIIFDMLSGSTSGRINLSGSSTSRQKIENEEKWEIVRDDNGNLSEIVVHREVK
ncbi:hypothetical protein KAR91_77850 [Candidatus Pacearchaeota archaeon]|nr:hypothetical protein [Candidatus Pacearchaeota archaeon]